jgi:hypothetical protein
MNSENSVAAEPESRNAFVSLVKMSILHFMETGSPLSSSLLRRAENTELSLGSLEAIAAIRARIDVLEEAAMISAKDKGATMEDIAEALGLTPQAIYYRFRNRRNGDAEPVDAPAPTDT